MEFAPVALADLQADTGDPAVAACLTPRECVTRWIEAPYRSSAKSRKVLPTLLDVELPFPLDECIHDFLDEQATPSGTTRALAVVARTESVQNSLKELAGIGLDPMVLDHEGLAAWTQSVKELPPEATASAWLRAVLLLRSERWTLVIGRGTEYMNSHNVRQGDFAQVRRLLMAATARDGKAGPDDAFGEESVYPKVKWMLAGPLAADAGAVRQVNEVLIRKGRDELVVHSEPGSFVARALATRALEKGPLRCNMRAGSLAHPAIIARLEGQSLKSALMVLAAGLLLCGGALFAISLANRADVESSRAFAGVVAKLGVNVGAAQGEHAVGIARNSIASRLDTMRPFLNAFEPSLVDTVSDAAGLCGKKGIGLEQLVISRDKVQISGKTKNWNACDELLGLLQQGGYKARLERKENLADEVVSFTISTGDRK